MNRKIVIISILSTILFVLVASGFYLFLLKKTVNQQTRNEVPTPSNQKPFHASCLADDEVVEYDRISQHPDITQPKEMSPFILVSNKNTKEITASFRLDNVNDSGHPMEVHKCGVYFIRDSEFDKKNGIHTKHEFWKYTYDQEKMILISNEEFKPFSLDFLIDPKEKFISLEQWYGGRDDYALVIKELKTLKDAFVLPVAKIVKESPSVIGDIGFDNGGWTSDGRFFWFHLFQTAEIVGFVRVDTDNWSYKIFPAPFRTMGGDTFNINNGMITYSENVAPWTADEGLDQQYQAEAKRTGQISSFFIYNLFTKQKYLVATTTDPTYYFRPQWISDTKLQYELPNGERRVYEINIKK